MGESHMSAFSAQTVHAQPRALPLPCLPTKGCGTAVPSTCSHRSSRLPVLRGSELCNTPDQLKRVKEKCRPWKCLSVHPTAPLASCVTLVKPLNHHSSSTHQREVTTTSYGCAGGESRWAKGDRPQGPVFPSLACMLRLRALVPIAGLPATSQTLSPATCTHTSSPSHSGQSWWRTGHPPTPCWP